MSISSDKATSLQAVDADFSKIADDLGERGVTAIPLAIDKKPLIEGWERGCDGPLDVPAVLWREAAGIGVCLGRDLGDGARLACLDVDFYTEDHDARAKTEAAILAVLREIAPGRLFPVCRGFKGIKVFLGVCNHDGAWPGKPKLRNIDGHLDLLGHGRQAVIPPSSHLKGIIHTWDQPGNDLEGALLFGMLPVVDPCALLAKLAAEGLIEETGGNDRPDVSPPAEPVNLAALDTFMRQIVRDHAENLARKAVKRIAGAQQGERNDTLAAQAFFAGRVAATGVLDRDDLLSRVIEAALEVGDDRKKDEATAKRQFEEGEAFGAIPLASPDEVFPEGDELPETEDLRSYLPGLRPELFGNLLLRGYITITAAPSGLGKSALVLTEAAHMAAGRAFAGRHCYEGALKIWMLSVEDDSDEIARRLQAILAGHDMQWRDFSANLKISHDTLCLVKRSPKGVVVNEARVKRLIEHWRGFDVVIIDPVAETYDINENDQSEVRVVMALWRRIAQEAGVAVQLVAHTPKTARRFGEELGVEAVRGASTFVDVARVARTLIRMSAKRPEATGMTEAQRARYVGEYNGKANYAPPAAAMRWYRQDSHDLGNGDNWRTNDAVKVVHWEPPCGLAPAIEGDLLEAFIEATPHHGWHTDGRSPDYAGKWLSEQTDTAWPPEGVREALNQLVADGAFEIIQKNVTGRMQSRYAPAANDEEGPT